MEPVEQPGNEEPMTNGDRWFAPGRRAVTLMIAALLTACTASDQNLSTATSPGVVTIPTITTTTLPAPASIPAEPSTTAKAEIPEGWIVFEGAEISIAAPPSWIDASDLAEDPAAITELDDEVLASRLATIGETTLAAVDLLLIDEPAPTTNSPTIMDAIVVPVDPLTDLVAVERIITAQIDASPWNLLAASTSDVAGVETLVLDYALTLETGETPARQYHQIRAGDLLSLTFIGEEGEPGSWERMVGTASLTN